ncbi:hypothetical protein N0V90_000303 [Kalmusia sp. IMI 367209]|nr:hypothetical protein N0V90_000303 [Kalmusia sp. IMI 367209]
MSCPRIYPLRKPPNHRLPVPRYTLNLPPTTTHIHTLYLGIQQHSSSDAASQAIHQASRAVYQWLNSASGPAAHETFTLIDRSGDEDAGTTMWVCYWASTAQYKHALSTLNLKSIHSALGEGRSDVGLYLETFSTPVSRLETNYSGQDYLPGLARLPDTSVVEHELATYWGAARDRIPDSAHDLFPPTIERF